VESRSRESLASIQVRGIQPPFRDLYLAEDRDIVIYKTLINFFSAASSIFWSKRDSGLIRKTAGIQALFGVLKELLPEQIEEKNLQLSIWESILSKAQSLDFSNIQISESSGRGRTRIQDAIFVAIGKKQPSDISDEDFRSYLESIVKVATE
jgi:hypothetical protein